MEWILTRDIITLLIASFVPLLVFPIRGTHAIPAALTKEITNVTGGCVILVLSVHIIYVLYCIIREQPVTQSNFVNFCNTYGILINYLIVFIINYV